MPPPCFLNARVHAVAVGEDLVLLDETRDRYLCARDAAAALGRTACGAQILDPALAAQLEAAGLAGPEPQPFAGAPPPPKPTRSLDPVGPDLRPADAVDALRSGLDLLAGYRGRSFAKLLDLARAGWAGCREDPDAALDAAARVRAQLVWVPAPPKCLARSFLLVRALQRRGLAAHWVIAVRTWPFRAHCWVQAGDLALDEAAERLAAYVPILAV